MCTGIVFQTEDKKYIFGRTLEFGFPLTWKHMDTLNIIGTMGKFPNNSDWYLLDGVNSSGLCVGTFFYPHYDSEYSTVEKEGKLNIHTGELNLYLLNNCNSVEEVIEILDQINMLETNIDGELFSLHWMVCDTSGECVVLETKNKKLVHYDNKNKVITNSPSFPEQIENLQNYIGLSKYNKPGSMSQGSGAVGLPGDTTALSRFVRANFYNENIITPRNAEEGKEGMIRILHNFDIPLGTVQDKQDKTVEVAQYTVSYCIDDFSMKYAPYGYIQEDGKWVQTDSPVIITSFKHYLLAFVVIFCLIIITPFIFSFSMKGAIF